MVRAGEKAHLFELCRDQGLVTIGWFERDMSGWSPADLERWFGGDYPVGGSYFHRDVSPATWTRAKVTRDTNQVGDFLFSLPVGRVVTMASPNMEELLVGAIAGAC